MPDPQQRPSDAVADLDAEPNALVVTGSKLHEVFQEAANLLREADEVSPGQNPVRFVPGYQDPDQSPNISLSMSGPEDTWKLRIRTNEWFRDMIRRKQL